MLTPLDIIKTYLPRFSKTLTGWKTYFNVSRTLIFLRQIFFSRNKERKEKKNWKIIPVSYKNSDLKSFQLSLHHFKWFACQMESSINIVFFFPNAIATQKVHSFRKRKVCSIKIIHCYLIHLFICLVNNCNVLCIRMPSS